MGNRIAKIISHNPWKVVFPDRAIANVPIMEPTAMDPYKTPRIPASPFRISVDHIGMKLKKEGKAKNEMVY